MSIRLRATLVTALFLAFAAIALSILALSLQRRMLTIETQRKVQMAVSMLAEMSAPPLRSGDILALALISDRAARGQPSRVSIADRHGKILADSEHESYDQTNDMIQHAIRSNREVTGRSEGFFEAAAPVTDYSGRIIGAVHVTFSDQPLEDQLGLLFNRVAGLAALSVLLGALLAYLFGRYLSSSFTPALTAMRKAAAGQLGARAPRVGVAELDEVGDTFNRMSATIEKRVRDLERLNQMAAELSTALTADEFANSVCTTLSAFSNAHCDVILGDPSTGALKIVGSDIYSGRAAPTSAVAIASRERRAITIGLTGDLSPGSEVVAGMNRDSAIVAPLITPAGESVGALVVTYD